MDEKYIRQVIDGDKNAFRHIVKRYKDKSFTLALSIVKSEFIAKDVVQDAFIKAYQNLDSFKGNSKFSTWLYRIVVNESLKKVRQNKLSVYSDKTDIDETPCVADSSALENLHKFERLQIIHKIMQDMPQTESLIMRLFYLEENSLEEIKEITTLKKSNIKVILHRARKRFYLMLEKQLKHELKTIL